MSVKKGITSSFFALVGLGVAFICFNGLGEKYLPREAGVALSLACSSLLWVPVTVQYLGLFLYLLADYWNS